MTKDEVIKIEEEIIYLEIFITERLTKTTFDNAQIKNAMRLSFYRCFRSTITDKDKIDKFFDCAINRSTDYQVASETPHHNHIGSHYVVGTTLGKYCSHENNPLIAYVGSGVFVTHECVILDIFNDWGINCSLTL